MHLEVSLHRDGSAVAADSWTLTQLDEAEKIGLQLARVMRNWIRSRPIRKGGSRIRFDVYATWREDGAAPVVERAGTTKAAAMKPRRRKAAK